MPINRIKPSGRAAAAIAAVLSIATTFGGVLIVNQPGEKPVPASVRLSIDKLIKPWEGVHLKAYRDIVDVWTICWGETKGVTPGMIKTLAECDAMLTRRVVNDYYMPLTKCIAGFDTKPISLQASLISGAYNFGVAASCRSTAARLTREGSYRQACEAQTAFNKAGGQVVNGLVKRREMGDVQRIGEAELCVSGI